MAKDTAAKYIGETIDAIKNYGSNKTKRLEAEEEIDSFLDGYESSKLPEKPRLDEVPSYERVNYEAPTDEELTKTAESELGYYKSSGEDGIVRENEELRRKYERDTANAAQAHTDAVAATEQSYAGAKQNVDNDMLKRGLARSSIAVNKRAELESGEAAAKANLAQQLSIRITEINEQLSSLDAQREKALNDFNLAYAARLTQRISELKSERDKKQTEAIKYNNTLTQKEHEQNIDKTVKENSLYESALRQQKAENEMQNLTNADYEKIYQTIAHTLRSINMHDAREIILNNPRIAQSVTPQYYYKLYDEFCR